MHAVRPDPEIAHQEGIPVVVIDLQDRGRIVGEPALPQFGARPRLGAGAGQEHEQAENHESEQVAFLATPSGSATHASRGLRMIGITAGHEMLTQRS